MSKRFLVLLSVLALAMTMLAPMGAADDGAAGDDAGSVSVVKSTTGSYVVVMEADPLVVEFEQEDLDSKAAKRMANGLKKGHDKALKDAGVKASAKVNDFTVALNGFSAAMSYEEAEEVARQDGVALVLPDEMRYPTTDSSPAFLGLTDPAGPWATGYDGEDIVVGIIDNGIWPEHPSFADDGSYSDLGVVLDDSRPNCEFGNTDHNSNDAPFTCNNKLLGARQMLDTYRFFIGADPDEFDSARDDDGHGTHTASTAAGNEGVAASIYGIPRGEVSGIAPRARVIAYKGLGRQGGFTSDLAAAIDQAVADGVDVINYSIGGGAGGPGADEIAFLFADAAGVFVATSAGNSGPGAATLGNPGTMPWLTTVGASTQERTFQGSVSSSDGWEFFGASITGGTDEQPLVDAADYGNELCLAGTAFTGDISGKIVLCKRGAEARVFKSLAVFESGGAGTILYNTSDSQAENTDNHWTPTVHISNTNGLTIKAYIDSMGSAAVAQINGGEFTPIPGNSMASFSSRGPNPVSGDIIKPDITAPGVNILAGASPFPEPGFYPGELFQSIGGTSMSSPHIAGVFALLKQAHPDWSPAMAKSAIMTTARQDIVKEDELTPADPFDFGAGHVDPGKAVHKGSAFQPGLAYDAGLFEYAAYTCGEDFGVFTQGSCDFLESIGVPSEAENLNYPSIGIAEVPGSKTVMRTVTSVAQDRGWRTYKASVEPPPGYTVSVEPSTLRLKSGQSATFYVTVTNESAPIGEWRFGSMTWEEKTGNYSVYSPIAVKGALFEAPAAVSGSGEDSSVSFDVSFGYTGSYGAAAHGLEPAIVTSDTVVQDPDQTFSQTDGFSNLHQFNLSGEAFLRIAMPPEAVGDPAIDLDLFLYNPSGVQVASSTSGGTDELIEIVLPVDGTWSLYVHGWQTAGPSAAYDLFTWIISATPGGNMTVGGVPTDVTVGDAATLTASWSGATAGQWHLGAVSHTVNAGLVGLTLVEVDNR